LDGSMRSPQNCCARRRRRPDRRAPKAARAGCIYYPASTLMGHAEGWERYAFRLSRLLQSNSTP
jgi:hypothetical protein